MDEEENQVHGYSHVNDESGLTMGHLSAWTLTDIRNMLRCIQNSTPMRHKETHFINIPSYATKVIEFAVSLLNDKLKGRVLVSIVESSTVNILRETKKIHGYFAHQVHKNLDELKEAIDPKILPKEYGGEIPMADMIGEYIRLSENYTFHSCRSCNILCITFTRKLKITCCIPPP